MSGEQESLLRRVRELEEENKRLAQRLEFEMVGRTRAEKNLREKIVGETDGAAGQLRPVGYVKSCFPTRFGTPRQGSLASLSRGTIKLDNSIVGHTALTGLDAFSHVWVVFIFHENTNMHKFAKDEARPLQKKLFPSFVRPPQAGGARVGLFATRTPHRPNPVGLSLARVESVDLNKGILHLRGIDLIEGTPVLDIKPFVPHVDRPPESEVRLPGWVENPKFNLAPVHMVGGTREALIDACERGRSKWFSAKEASLLVDAVEQILALDPRGVIHGRGAYKGATSPGAAAGGDQAAQGDDAAALGAAKSTAAPEVLDGAHGTAAPARTHLFRDDFVLDFDAFRLHFSPHETERAIVLHRVEPAGRKPAAIAPPAAPADATPADTTPTDATPDTAPTTCPAPAQTS